MKLKGDLIIIFVTASFAGFFFLLTLAFGAAAVYVEKIGVLATALSLVSGMVFLFATTFTFQYGVRFLQGKEFDLGSGGTESAGPDSGNLSLRKKVHG